MTTEIYDRSAVLADFEFFTTQVGDPRAGALLAVALQLRKLGEGKDALGDIAVAAGGLVRHLKIRAEYEA